MYPYTAGMTDIGSAIFDEGWQAKQGGIGFGDLQWALTGERLTAESFARYRQQGGMVAIHSIPEDIVRLAIANPLTMIASDGILEQGKGIRGRPELMRACWAAMCASCMRSR